MSQWDFMLNEAGGTSSTSHNPALCQSNGSNEKHADRSLWVIMGCEHPAQRKTHTVIPVVCENGNRSLGMVSRFQEVEIHFHATVHGNPQLHTVIASTVAFYLLRKSIAS